MSTLARRCASFLGVLLCPLLWGQNPGYLTGNNTTGFPSYASFIRSEIDSVNLGNGGLTIRIPLISRSYKGFEQSFTFGYDSKFWVVDHYQTEEPPLREYYQWRPDGTWQLLSSPGGALDWTEQQITCAPWPNPWDNPALVLFKTNWQWRSFDGTKYQFPTRKFFPIYDAQRCQEYNAGWTIAKGYSNNGYMEVDISTNQRLDSNYSIRFRNGWTEDWNGIQDTNGNECCNPALLTQRDTGDPYRQEYVYVDSNGVEQVIKANWIQIPVETSFPTTGSDRVVFRQTGRISLMVLGSLVLPNNLSYVFSYNDLDTGLPNLFGEVTRITLPTGGHIDYKWATVAQRDDGPGAFLDARVLVERRVSDGTHEDVWKYDYSDLVYSVNDVPMPTAAPYHYTTTVTTPTGDTELHWVGLTGEEFRVTYNSLRTVETGWESDDGPVATVVGGTDDWWNVTFKDRNLRKRHITTTLLDTNPTMTAKTESNYEDCHTYTVNFTVNDPAFPHSFTDCRDRPTRTIEYDYPAGSVALKTTEVDYYHKDHQAYFDAHIWDRVGEKRVYDAAGNLTGKTAYLYDTTALASTPTGVLGHDDNFNGGRGNLTEVRNYVNSTSYLSTLNYYNGLGNLVQTQDPGGHSTSFDYTDNYTDGINHKSDRFVTQITHQNTGAVSHIERRQYYWNTGLLAASCGENFPTSSTCSSSVAPTPASPKPDFLKYTYDLLGRPISIVRGDGGLTTYTYNEASLPITIAASQTLDSSRTSNKQAQLDGLGRIVKTQLLSDPQGTINIDTTYDGRGRVHTLTTPYRTTADRTYGTTQYQYDGLSRLRSITQSDGGTITTEYAGNAALQTDEAGRQRRTYTDAAGKLVRADEPSSVPLGETPAAAASASVDVSGSPQPPFMLPGQPPTTSSGSVRISGAEQAYQVENREWMCELWLEDGSCFHETWVITYSWEYDVGTVTVSVGWSTKTVSYGSGSDTSSVAAAIASAFNTDPDASVSASNSGDTVYFTSRAAGAGANYPISVASATTTCCYFSEPSFQATASGPTLTGGADATQIPLYDTGTVWIAVNDAQQAVNYDQNSSPESVAEALVFKINAAGPAYPVTASRSGTRITLTSRTAGVASNNYTLAAGSDMAQKLYFSQASFGAVPSSQFVGGKDAEPTGGIWSPIVTAYTYNALGDLTCVEQHGGVSGTGCSSPESNDSASPWRVRRFSYDWVSRLLSAKTPESGTATYSYDVDGNVMSKTDARGHTISYCYDGLHRLRGKKYAASIDCNDIASWDAQFDYDSPQGFADTFPVGRRTYMRDASGTTTWGYDVMGRTVTENRTIGSVLREIEYGYNLDGTVSTVTYPHKTGEAGATLSYTYNSAGVPVSASGRGIDYVTNATYAPHGALAGLTAGGNVTITDSYNKRLQPLTFSAARPGTTLFSLTYDFHLGAGDNGNVHQITNDLDNLDTNRPVGTMTFTYDLMNRISSAQSTGTDCSLIQSIGLRKNWGNSFTIDAWGNLASKDVTKCEGESLAEAVGNDNRFTGAGRYDAAGNLVENGRYGYDAENRLTHVGGIEAYVYDGDGKRVKKNAGRLYWTGTGADALAETDSSGTLLSEYIFFDGKRIARRDADGSVFYYFSDHLGSSRVITRSDGTVCYEADFYPYGGERVIKDECPNSYKFAGKERDSDTGLDYSGARYYGFSASRFLSPDPLLESGRVEAPQTWNRYSYGLNNPLRFVDPSGLLAVCSVNGADENCAMPVEDSETTAQSEEAQNSQTAAQPNGNGNSSIVSISLTSSAPGTLLGGLIGELINPVGGGIPGSILGSMIGTGANVSYVPSTDSWYAGPTASFTPAPFGGNGVSASDVLVPSGQNPNSIANGTSYSVSFQPTPLTGSTVTKSPGSGPAVAGPAVGTKVPLSFSASHNFNITQTVHNLTDMVNSAIKTVKSWF